MEKKRILFMAEAVTLAHVSRLAVLAESLDPSMYEVHFACEDGYDFVFKNKHFQRWHLPCASPAEFLRKLASGNRLYDYSTLQNYIEQDSELIGKVRPDAIIGDFRLSLAISAPVNKVPYVTVTNAYWSPYAQQQFPLPEHPMVRLCGVTLAELCFRAARPAIFAYHIRPLNALRRRHGLPAFDSLPDAYTHADYTLYADLPELVPTRNLPSNHHYIGPIVWSPDIASPSWYDKVQTDSQSIYVTFGSSGRFDLLPEVIDALSPMPVNVFVATAGRCSLPGKLPDNVYVATYLPDTFAGLSDLVICNGGSPTVYQALVKGKPVIGIASNMDQFLNMKYVSRAGAGLLLRAGRTSSTKVRSAVETLLRGNEYRAAARHIAAAAAQYSTPSRFREFMAGMVAL